MNNPLELLDLDDKEDANKVRLMVETSLCNRRWRNQNSANWFEPDPEYDSDSSFDHQLTLKRYLRLVNSPAYRLEPTIELAHLPSSRSELKDTLPAYLDVVGRRIVPALKSKILSALPIHSRFFGDFSPAIITVRTLFYETKLCGFYYDYKAQKWEYGQSKKKLKRKG
jgi:hypothetical protein